MHLQRSLDIITIAAAQAAVISTHMKRGGGVKSCRQMRILSRILGHSSLHIQSIPIVTEYFPPCTYWKVFLAGLLYLLLRDLRFTDSLLDLSRHLLTLLQSVYQVLIIQNVT